MSSDITGTVLYFGVIVAVFYFLIIRPQSRQRKQHSELVDSLVAGDQIVTSGGMYGTVKAVTEDTIDLEIAPGTVVTVARQAVSQKAE
jgi:preprotein translocase subunit YajC